jgi:mannose-6-phosphate isomerase-like protein (cupin superfamily)
MIEETLAGRTIGSPDGSFVVGDWVDQGETSRDFPIAPLHVHHHEDEAWYMLEGRLGFRIGDEEVEAGPGAAVLVPAGEPHAYWNAGDARARYLIVMAPKTARLVAEIHELASFDIDVLRELFRKHDSELLL